MKTKDRLKKIIFWSPRVLAILFALFISMFAFDVFGSGDSVFVMVAAFLIHLIPTFAVAALIFVAWKWELIGGTLFIVLGLVFTIFFHTYREVLSFLLISFPVFLTGALFLLSWKVDAKRNMK